jgi:hypothetical protein
VYLAYTYVHTAVRVSHPALLPCGRWIEPDQEDGYGAKSNDVGSKKKKEKKKRVDSQAARVKVEAHVFRETKAGELTKTESLELRLNYPRR